MQNKIKQLANYYREKGNYKFAAALCKISTDLALYEQKQEIVTDLQEKLVAVANYKQKLKACHLYKQADQLDVIAKDLEA
jgi:glycyl-tRNA synthetase alpha subunit